MVLKNHLRQIWSGHVLYPRMLGMSDPATEERVRSHAWLQRAFLAALLVLAATAVSFAFVIFPHSSNLCLPTAGPSSFQQSPSLPLKLCCPSYCMILKWSASQIIRSVLPESLVPRLWRLADVWEQSAWAEWEAGSDRAARQPMDVPEIDVRELITSCGCGGTDYKNDCPFWSSCVAGILGNQDWLSRPLLLRSLWDESALRDRNRVLSLHGLLSDPEISGLVVPYYADASESGYGALKPSSVAELGKIIRNVTESGGKQKVGTQAVVNTRPDLIYEIAEKGGIIAGLFGDRFQPKHVRGSGPWRIFPAQTTVPLFFAGQGASCGGKHSTCSGNHTDNKNVSDCATNVCSKSEASYSERDVAETTVASGEQAPRQHAKKKERHSRTDLHCEPIGNVAVQLHGTKTWTLISPSHPWSLRPSVSRHGRAFFYSNIDSHDTGAMERVDRYMTATGPGDALWVPPWMWHRVDYIAMEAHQEKEKVEYIEEDCTATTGGMVAVATCRNSYGAALAASLFHFRPVEFAQNNPLFALLVVPNLIKELIGAKVE